MSRRAEGRNRYFGRVEVVRRGRGGAGRCGLPVEPLEGRVFLSVSAQADLGFRLVGITGNQQSDLSARYPDETLFDIKVGSPGTDPAFLDGFNPPQGAATTLMTVDAVPGTIADFSDPITQGTGALRVDVPQTGGTFWGLRSPNVVDLLGYGAQKLEYDETFIGRELNGGAFVGDDNSFVGYAQSNEMAINLSDGTWIQKRLDAVGTDDSGLPPGQWAGTDRTHHITWDLNQFLAPGDIPLRDYIADPVHNITGAWFVLPTQGGENNPATANGTQGPMRFYFDDFQISAPKTATNSEFHSLVGDFDPVSATKMVTLPFVPDSDAIGYNPDNGLLYRTSGSWSYRNDPNRVGYNDNQFMESVDINSPNYTQTGIYNANYEGDAGTGPYGVPAPRPNWVLPTERRTGDTDPNIGSMTGPNEIEAIRDLAWSASEHLFYVASHNGIFKLTPTGESTKATASTFGGQAKGITFATIEGQNRLLVAQRDIGTIAVIDTADMSQLGTITLFDSKTEALIPGLVALETGPDGMLYGIANKPDLFFQRDLVRIDPATGETTTIGTVGLHIASLAIVAQATPAAPDVYVRGSAWSAAFKQYLEAKGLGDDAYGYKVASHGSPVTGPAANPEQILPWINVNEVVLKYATAPTGSGIPTAGSVTFTSQKGQTYTATAVTPVAGDPTAFVVTLNQPLGGGNPATGVAPTATQNGDHISLIHALPGPGAVLFSTRFDVLQGDTDHTGETAATHTVLAADYSAVKKKFFKNTTDTTNDDTSYSAFHDVDGSGSILANDFSEVKKRFFQNLAPPPVPGAEALAGSSITSDLFGGTRIL